MDLVTESSEPACLIAVMFTEHPSQMQVPYKLKDGQTVMAPLLQSHENITGKISIEPAVPGEKVEHNGIKVELLGQIEMLFDRSKDYEFISQVYELDPGEIYEIRTYPFEFSGVEMPHDTYHGVKVNLRYVLKVTMSSITGGNVVKDQEIVVLNCSPAPPLNNPIKIEFKYESYFHAQVEYDKDSYHLKDVIRGEIQFDRLKRLRIKTMYIELKRRESFESLEADEKTTVANVVLKNGAPPVIGAINGILLSCCCWNMDEGKSFPIRIPLSQFELTPTYEGIHNQFSVTYYLKLVLDTEIGPLVMDKREITLYRLRDNTVP